MNPTIKPPATGHDVDGNMFALKYDKKGNEISRTPIQGQKVIWIHRTADLGIKKFKRENKDSYMREIYKENAWKDSQMRDEIAHHALLAKPEEEKEKKSKKKLDK